MRVVFVHYYTANGQIILSAGVVVPERPGAKIRRNISIAYVVPAVDGTVRITGAPSNFGSLAYMGVQACPARGAFGVGCKDGQEAYEDIAPGSSYLIDLHRGRWRVAAYYWADNNTKNFTGRPVVFTSAPGSTRHINVKMNYQGS